MKQTEFNLFFYFLHSQLKSYKLNIIYSKFGSVSLSFSWYHSNGIVLIIKILSDTDFSHDSCLREEKDIHER